ncbi:AlkA N-terminal domain-containing protein [Gordonia sp. CPCC 205515]|uniref:DNA-3-methyladenine glycosylase 2 family protein n=1 Tax=Gordonia sp. CPCC 205515 TaxID=3140791 RepID=UPI003AF34FCE
MPTTTTATDTLDFDRCYRALSARDTRFDGQFYVTVRTTGIYCRPSCPAQTPRRENVHFVITAAAAQHLGYRACRRCAPDAVPGSPRWNSGADLSSRAMRLIADGIVDRAGVDGLAAQLGYTPRHLNRVLSENLGAGPLALARAHRAATARILIQCTAMPMSDIAFAAGFTSIRQFNDTVREVFALTPTQLRRLRSPVAAAAPPVGGVSLRLAYRSPLDTRWLHWFLAGHAVTGTEEVDDLGAGRWRYRRALRLPHGPALVTLQPADGHVVAELTRLDMRDLGVAVNRIRRLLDLDADAESVDAALAGDPLLAPLVAAAPGLRVPGSVDPGETLIRTMIGQQISVKAARHHVDRLVAALGEPLPADGHDDLPPGDWRLFPQMSAIAEHGREVLSGPQRRIDAIVAVAGAVASGRVDLHAGRSTPDLRADLLALPGIGPWTADYVAMRITGDPDILLDTDLVVARAAADLGIDLAGHAHRWSPWRSYASMHLWRHALSVRESILTPATTTEPMMTPPRTRAPRSAPSTAGPTGAPLERPS